MAEVRAGAAVLVPAGRTAVINIGEILSGDLAQPMVAGADTVIVDGNGQIEAVGDSSALSEEATSAARVIDVHGATVAPALIDSHCHVLIGDYTPRQQAIGFLEAYTHGGIARVISAGEIHAAGLPQVPAAVKAIAIATRMSFDRYQPGGMQVDAGTVLLTPGLVGDDFDEMHAVGVRLAKFGFGAYDRPQDGIEDVRTAQAHGLQVMCHSGGPTAPTSASITAEDLLALAPDVYGHVNGGPTSLDDDGVRRLVHEGTGALQLVQAGNLASALRILRLAVETNHLARVVIGTDTPTGTGVMPLGMLKTVAELSSLGGVAPEVVWCFATGNNAEVFGVGGGAVRAGHAADLIVMDAPLGSAAASAREAIARGDVPGVAAVIIAGQLRVHPSRNTPIPARRVSVQDA
ncbi:MAG: amidohydrolase family protein [Acidimicrobiales bacterium]